jgi:N utilization substance protein B
VIGVTSRLEEIDGLVASKLASGWTLGRLDKTMLQILRCGTFELVAQEDVPIATVIDEYLDVAHAFFNKKDAGFVNGLLDSIAKQVRG